jgi:4-amino-4-deoxy-L-arabinose transferase-like glycosyltransferase
MSRRRLAILIALLLTALALRLAAGWWWQSRLPGRFGFGDSDGYWTLARAIAHGGPYQYGEDRVFRAPGYPLLLAPLFLVRDDPPIFWGRALTALAATAAVAALGWLAWRLFGARTALVAMALGTFYPGAVFLGGVILSESLFMALLVAQLAAWSTAATAASTQRSAWLALGAGMLGGAATLAHPSWLFFTPFAMPLGFIGRPWRRSLTEAACVSLGLLIAIGPWVIRNARATGHLVPTTLQVGASLYDGLNPQATGASDMRFVDAFRAELQREPVDPGAASLEFRLDQRLRREAIAWAQNHPADVLRLSLVKLGRMWNLWPNDQEFSSWTIRLAAVFTYVPLLVFAIMGTVRTLRRGWPCWLCWLPAVYLTLLHMVFVGSVRYREPAMLPWAAVAAVAFVALWDKGVARNPQAE